MQVDDVVTTIVAALPANFSAATVTNDDVTAVEAIMQNDGVRANFSRAGRCLASQ